MALSADSIKDTYPLPIYNYRVEIEGATVAFAEVSGLSVGYEAVTYKHGFSFVMGNKIIPGMRQPINLSLKRGIIKGRDFLPKWLTNTYGDPFYTQAKRDIRIDLCDQDGQAVMRWKVQNALPTKLDAPTFDANSNEIAIESLDLIAHGLQIDYNP